MSIFLLLGLVHVSSPRARNISAFLPPQPGNIARAMSALIVKAADMSMYLGGIGAAICWNTSWTRAKEWMQSSWCTRGVRAWSGPKLQDLATEFINHEWKILPLVLRHSIKKYPSKGLSDLQKHKTLSRETSTRFTNSPAIESALILTPLHPPSPFTHKPTTFRLSLRPLLRARDLPIQWIKLL